MGIMVAGSTSACTRRSSLQLPPPKVLTVVTAVFLAPAHVVAFVIDERGGRDEKPAKGMVWGGALCRANQARAVACVLSTAPVV